MDQPNVWLQVGVKVSTSLKQAVKIPFISFRCPDQYSFRIPLIITTFHQPATDLGCLPRKNAY